MSHQDFREPIPFLHFQVHAMVQGTVNRWLVTRPLLGRLLSLPFISDTAPHSMQGPHPCLFRSLQKLPLLITTSILQGPRGSAGLCWLHFLILFSATLAFAIFPCSPAFSAPRPANFFVLSQRLDLNTHISSSGCFPPSPRWVWSPC